MSPIRSLWDVSDEVKNELKDGYECNEVKNELKDGYECNEVKNELKDGYEW